MNVDTALKTDFSFNTARSQKMEQSASLTQVSNSPSEKPQAQARSEVDMQALQQAAQEVSKVVERTPHSLQFSVDKDSGKPVVTVIDRNTNEVITQIPSEEMLEISKHLDQMTGLLLKTEA